MKILSFCIFCLLVLQFFMSCGSDPVQEMEQHIEQYENNDISNSRMLLELGKVFAEHQQNADVRNLYFSRMVPSGHTTSVLYTYLAHPELINSEKDNNLILNALREGPHYELASDFKAYLAPEFQEQIDDLIDEGKQLELINRELESRKSPDVLSERGVFYVEAGEQDMGEMDFNAALDLDSCHEEALFHKCILQFKKDSGQNVKEMLENCSGNELSLDGQDDWYASFYQLSEEISEINQSFSREEDRLFHQAKLFADNNFPGIALEKTKKLTELAPDNADYLALRAFVYYRLGNKPKAMEFISRAENITGKQSKLRGMIENMKE